MAPPRRPGRSEKKAPPPQTGRRGRSTSLLCFVLVVDVEDDGCEQNQALDDLLVVNADGQDRHAIVHHAHQEGADNGPDHGPHATATSKHHR